MKHLFRWTARRQGATETLFYDGECGLCHGFVRFVLAKAKAKDRSGRAFRFAPLGGEAFARLIPGSKRGALPDSVVVMRADGALLVRSAAVIHVLRRLGGFWRVLAFLLRAIPGSLRDRFYDLIARTRRALFRKPAATCPVQPDELSTRFDA
jgi:predicted DCC family thiol-disulfide oxidoreductase YuxK